ncbi:MAG TPA: phosphoenolpyruvate carboxykinase [Actinomycetes bacterium]|jgi:phosphoenolpyruvate carboxykinase (ATP)|nr:phosphoenolpyruvate carboxykinase [Actinomycetes bacterium]
MSSTVSSDLDIIAKSIAFRPTEAELRAFTDAMPQARQTRYGNVNVQTKVLARSKASTYVVSDRPEEHTDQTVSREEGRRIARIQDDYIRERDMVVVDGFIGHDGPFRSPARLIIEKANANIAGMQRFLYYDPVEGDQRHDPEITIIYTPNLTMPGYPDDRVIVVDLEAGVTRVINSDYFGESKKGGLRMWNTKVYDGGGLAMHAGCKVIPTGDGHKTMLIVGLSGTGKTTTTFTKQNASQAVQDDFIGLFPGGEVISTEDGCFAKTFALDPRDEPAIYGAVTKPDAYLENVSQTGDELDFFDTSYTHNGRAVFNMRSIDNFPPDQVPPASFLLILNRNENIVPAVAKLNVQQAAGYFMLGETQGTSAGGKEEAGKALRVPGTNPFFPLRHEQQGNRLAELLAAHPLEVYLLNTGRIGGKDDDDRSKKVRIPHSSAVVAAIAEGTIAWDTDPDFGYLVASALPGIDDLELLQPRRLYERQGRLDEYREHVERLKAERAKYLAGFPGLDEAIVNAVT